VTNHSGEANSNWRGGRSIASNGYILVRVGTEHHLADVRGYAYEHRVVAEQTIGRRLEPGEVVHHIDHDKTNNSPGNLMVCTRAEHRTEHRTKPSMLRLPGEPNYPVACACGCGEIFDRFDSTGRPRRFIPGHNSVATSPNQLAILEYLGRGPAGRSELALALGRTQAVMSTALNRLAELGKISRGTRDRWHLADPTAEQQDAGTEPDLLTIAWIASEWSDGSLRDADFIHAIRMAMTRMDNRQ
jgi:hypothetical protein